MKRILLLSAALFVLFGCPSPFDAALEKIDKRDLHSFGFRQADNPTLDTDYDGTISGSEISVTLPAGSDVNALVAYYRTDAPRVFVAGVRQKNGETPNDFSSQVSYVFEAANGEQSAFLVTVIVEGSPPPAPSTPTLVPNDGYLSVSWTLVSGATDYRVYYHTENDPTAATQYPGSFISDEAVISDLTNSTPYYVWVTAVNSFGESDFSPVATATPEAAGTAPNAPAVPSVTPGDGFLDVSWVAVAFATTYTIHYNTVNNTVGASQITGIAGTSQRINSLTNGTPYYVWVTAVNAFGESDFSPVATATPEAAVVFVDSLIEAAVRDMISKSSGDIYPSELGPVQNLYILANANPVTSFEGLQYCTSLRTLTIYSTNYSQNPSEVTDLSPLTDLPQLTSLTIQRAFEHGSPVTGDPVGPLTDFSPLEGKTSLLGLHIIGQSVDNASFNSITNIPNLEILVLLYTTISDLAGIGNLSSLRVLNLGYGTLTNAGFAPIQNAADSLDNLYLFGLPAAFNNITPITANGPRVNLTELILTNGGSINLDSINGTNYPNLNQLVLELGTGFNNFAGISTLGNLQWLILQQAGIDDSDLEAIFSAPGVLPNLRQLELQDNSITSTAPINIAALTVSTLNLSNNQIDSALQLDQVTFTGSGDLDLSYNQLNDDSIIGASWPQGTLETLNLSYQSPLLTEAAVAAIITIGDPNPLSSLNLSGNAIADIYLGSGGLHTLTSLTSLDISDQTPPMDIQSSAPNESGDLSQQNAWVIEQLENQSCTVTRSGNNEF